jgi:hypothetical protein
MPENQSFNTNTDHSVAAVGNELPLNALFRVQGKMSTFGGPHDLGMKPDEGLALFEPGDLQDPRFKDLFLPAPPPGTTGLGRRLNPDKFYLACRWDYNVTSRSLLRNSFATVQSVKTGKTEQARPADWGPNAKTGRIADLSPGLAASLGLDTDDEVIITVTGNSTDFITPVAAKTFTGPAGSTEPKVFTTAEWGAAPAKQSHFAENSAAGIVVHNTENANRAPLTGDAEFTAAKAVALSIQAGHFARGFSDTGQHFTVSRGGLILEGRHGSLLAARAGKVVQGAHAVSDGNVINKTWFGIELEGDNRVADQVTAPQYVALVELCAWLTKWAGVPQLPIKGHMDVLAGHTDCPGKFEQHIPTLITDVNTRRGQL